MLAAVNAVDPKLPSLFNVNSYVSHEKTTWGLTLHRNILSSGKQRQKGEKIPGSRLSLNDRGTCREGTNLGSHGLFPDLFSSSSAVHAGVMTAPEVHRPHRHDRHPRWRGLASFRVCFYAKRETYLFLVMGPKETATATTTDGPPPMGHPQEQRLRVGQGEKRRG